MSSMPTLVLFLRAARRAASFTRLARSAPTSPGVERATTLRFTSSASGIFLVCTFRMPSRPFMPGGSTTICRSNRPGRSRAWSRTSGRLVAAIRITLVSVSNPSISTSSWLSVCSRSSWPPPRPAPRCLPTASSSSMNTIAGACFLACSNRSLTRLAPTPTNISTKSAPDRLKKGTLASPATARARRVLPVPGGPSRRAPLGILPPRRTKRLGLFRKSIISWSSSLASSQPATSWNDTWGLSGATILARLLPKLKIFPCPPTPPCIRRMMKNQKRTISRIGQALQI
ncbi:hypothetical protein ES703_56639 [subsurface metagenome]